jgi:predicted dehydrogenase
VREIRIGLIGAWGRGQLAFSAHRPSENIRIVAGADPSEKSIEKFRAKFANEPIAVYNDYRAMLEKEKLDAVFVCSPDYCHEEHALAALRKKMAVYLEKPMAITVEGCDRILETACQNKTKLFLGHNMRYMSFVHKMKEIIDSGEIGEVKCIWCRHFISYGGDAYFRDWHSERRYSNGLLLQKGAHDIDVIHWLAGAYSKKVTGMGSLSVYDKCEKRGKDEPENSSFNESHWPPLEQKGFSPVIDVEDTNMILMELSNGVQASYMQCHYTPDSCRNYTIIGTKGRIENYGDYGSEMTIEVWNTRKDGLRLHGDRSIQMEPEGGGHGGADEKIVRGFVDFLREDKKPFTSPVASRYSVAAGCAGTESIRNGGIPVEVKTLPAELEKYFI